MGVEPLAPLRRDAALPAAEDQAQRRLAAAARRPPQPRGAGPPPRLARGAPRRGTCRALARQGVRRAPAAPAQPSAAHAHAGSHVAAHVLPLPAPVRGARARAADLRLGEGALSGAAPRRAQPDPDRDAVRALALTGAVRGDRHAARARAVRRAHALDAGGAGAPVAEPPGEPGAALAAAVALQRPAADPPPRSAPRHAGGGAAQLRDRTRRSRRDGTRVASRHTSSACRWPSAPARSACSRRRPAAVPARWFRPRGR